METTRLDKLLKTALPGLRNRFIDELIDRGVVRNIKSGKSLKKGAKVVANEVDLAVVRAVLEEINSLPCDLNVPMLYQGEGFVVIDKPAGVPCLAMSLFERDTVVHWAKQHFPSVVTAFEDILPEVTPHRLDTGTSGLLIVANTKGSYDGWREAFEKKRVTKKYLAYCWGKPKENRFENNHSIAHDPKNSKKMVVTTSGEFREPVMEAQSVFQVRERFENYFSVECRCFTGATHQVRVHLAGLGFPLLGDSLYDDEYSRRPKQFPHHQLRAYYLESPFGTFECSLQNLSF